MVDIDDRKTHKITDKKIIETLLTVKEDEIDKQFILELFGGFDGKCKCHQWDQLTIPPGTYKVAGKPNKNEFTSTAGTWLFNKYFIEKDLTGILGYVNVPITSKVFKKLMKKLSWALNEDDVTLDQTKLFLEKTQDWMKHCTPLAGAWSEKMLTLTSLMNKQKDKLLKQYSKELSEGDIIVAEKVQKELLKFALDYMGNDPGFDGFLSGAGGSIDNNFMSMYIMKGAIRDPDPNAKQEYHIATSNYMDGISAEEYALYSKSLAPGPASRALKTAAGGYWEKLQISAHQHLKALDIEDCGTSGYIEEILTDDNIDDFMYCNVITGSSLTMITSKTVDKFKNRKVKIRFSSMCKCKDGFCKACLGDVFSNQNIKNVGLTTDVVPSKLKNICMKFFHDSSVTTVEMDPMEAFSMY